MGNSSRVIGHAAGGGLEDEGSYKGEGGGGGGFTAPSPPPAGYSYVINLKGAWPYLTAIHIGLQGALLLLLAGARGAAGPFDLR